MKKIVSLTAVFATISLITARADTLADWTFETSQPGVVTLPAAPGAGVAFSSFSPEIGSGTASALHTGAATYSSPAGNGSSHSFSVNTWAVGDYFQFQVNTVGFQNLTVSYDQTSSGTGPGLFNFAYSTDGINFSPFGSPYTVLANATPNPVWNATTSSSLYTLTDNLSSIIALNNAPTVYFRVIDASTNSAAGGTVAAGGTDRLDNFMVSAAPVPEPTTTALGILGGLACLVAMRRRP